MQQTANVDVGQRGATTGQHTARGEQGAADVTAPFRVPFTMGEVVKLTGLSRWTLRFWVRRGWVRPIVRSHGGRTHHHLFSGWQALGLAILGAAVRDVKDVNSYVGRTGVIRAMEHLAGLGDALLLPEHRQDPWLAERVAEIAAASLPSVDELSNEALEGVRRVVRAFDHKVAGMGNRTARRVPGEVTSK